MEVQWLTKLTACALDGVSVLCLTPATLLPDKNFGIFFDGGWLGYRAGVDECGEDKYLMPAPEFEPQDHPACSKLLYQLHYFDPHKKN
jgi:hypothetical protein